ncbi:INO80 complex subunit D [Armadillidium vulgare]|nr:INO80 complex subunit D [Armadillidium vulgare]
MMQENPHIPIFMQHNWPVKSSQSCVQDINKEHSHNVNIMKKPDVMNGLHNEKHLTAAAASPLGLDSSPGSNDTIINSKTSKVKWTVKNLTKREDGGRQLSNINSWLSSQKLDDKSSIAKTSNGNLQSQMTSGFDLAKLYPELSSKLGLIKSVSNDASKSPVGKSLHTKGGNNNSRVSLANSECSESNYKNSSVKAINTNSFHKSSLSFDKHCGNINATKNRFVSLSNDLKRNIVTKQKEKLDLTKLSEDKLRNIISCQSLNSKGSLGSPSLLKSDSKSKLFNKSKVTTVSLYDVVCNKTFPSNFTYPPASGSSLKPNNINILPKCSPAPMPNHKALSPTQLRVHNLYQDHYAYKSNFFPLGYESSESDSSDEEIGGNITSIPECLLRCKEDEDEESSKEDPSLSQNSRILEHYKQQVLSAKERLQVHENGLKRRWALTRALLEAARSNPNTAASTVSHFVKKLHSVLPSKRRQNKSRSSLLTTRNCVYENEDSKVCAQRALPGTRHCMRHITYNVDQQLFSQCAAKREDNSLCRIPTFHLLHEFPLCREHSDNANQMSEVSSATTTDAAAKAKRSRKKNKMPILSRYGKRNKKRRRSSLGSTSVVPSTSVRPPINSPGVCLGSPQSTSPITPNTSPSFSTPCSDPTGGGDESEFEDEFEGMVGSLPLEARDLQDVLNKIPEHEISQILYGADGKLGESNEDDDKKGRLGIGVVAPKMNTETSTLPPLCLDEGALGELISSSFNQQELNAISQVLSNMVGDGGLDLGEEFQGSQGSPTTAVIEANYNAPTEPPTPPVYISEDSNSGSVQSPQGIPSPTPGCTSLLHPNAKLKE